MAATPWSVKGIDPKAREVAKDLARRSRMTLGEWLNRVILEDDLADDLASPADFGARAHLRENLVVPLRPAPSDGGDFGRIARALDRLTDRIEASETRTGLAIAGVEHSVRQAVARIDTAERAQAETALRLHGAATADAPAGPRSAEALRMLGADPRGAPNQGPEAAAEMIAQLGRRLADAESRTALQLESLGDSLALLGRRLEAVEGAAPADIDLRLGEIAATLDRRVEAAREDFAQQLRNAGAGPAEDRLAALAAHVDAAEQRSARAIETMGREVLTLAEGLTRRMQGSENRSAEAIERVGGEMARIASAMEDRLGRAETTQAEALAKLGAEMGRLTERLTERLLGSERRAAQAIDDVGEQMSRVTERFERRQERASAELTESIRQSEERTAALLDDARRQMAGLPPAPQAFEPPLASLAALGVNAEDLIGIGAEDAGEDQTVVADEAVSEQEPPGPLLAADAGGAFNSAEAFAPIPEPAPPEEPAEVVAAAAPVPSVEPPEPEDVDNARPLSTREVIEQARAAARAAQMPPVVFDEERPGRPARKRGIFAGVLKAHRRPASTLQTALMVAGGAAFLSVGAAGVVLLEGPSPAERAPVIARAAIALAPQTSTPPAAGVAAADPAAAQAEFSQRYASVLAGLQSGKPGALAELKALAEAEYTPAQLFLAKLYEKGEAGVVVNAGEARRWVLRAAESGEPAAMHQLAVYDFRGLGAPPNLKSAAAWFRKAADRGVVDSQYNLALLYRSGSGVERNLPEAYRWFSIAAAAGDGPSRAAALELKSQLAPADLAGADATAATARPAAIPSESPASVTAAQRRLAYLGYFKRSIDGVSSPAFKVAVAAYQRDHGLPATGMLDPRTASRLTVARP